MIKKLSIAGGFAVAAVVTLTPIGIYIQKELENRKKEERIRFISQSNDAVDELNIVSGNDSVVFLKDSENEDKWKLMWIWDVYKWYRGHEKGNWNYDEEEIQKAEKLYWENYILKQQGKWKKQMTNKWLDQANEKPKHWEKFKEICLILMVNKKIDKDENMSTSGDNQYKLMCSFVDYHKPPWQKYEEYKKTTNPPLGIMEYFWKKYVFPTSQGK